MKANEIIVEIAGLDLNFRSIIITDTTPTALQILKAAGFKNLDQLVVVQILPSGDLEERRPDEICDLSERKPNRFVVSESDRLFRCVLDDRSVVWPEATILEEILRELGNVKDEFTIFIRREDQEDEPIDKGSSIDLGEVGTEILYSIASGWKINIQGVKIESEVPEISVRMALEKADFNPDQGWIIILKSASGKRQVNLDYVIDLREPGIEKLRLTPKKINNGETMVQNRRDFKLLACDEKYLAKMDCDWETVTEGARRWFIYHNYPLPDGYNVSQVELAIEVPTSYPGAQLDMFYCYPHLTLNSKKGIPQTQATEQISGNNFQRWSRHRGSSSAWNPASDNLITHLGLVEESIVREVN